MQVTFGSISSIDPKSRYHKLLAEFPELMNCSTNSTAKVHGVEHYIITLGQPPASPPRRLSPEKLRAAKAEFSYMMEQGICRPSSSQYAFPLHMVQKKETEIWRPYGDYRALNAKTEVIRSHISRTLRRDCMASIFFRKSTYSEHSIRFQ